MEAGVRQLCKE